MLPKAIICDLDGVLCDDSHRKHFINAHLKESSWEWLEDEQIMWCKTDGRKVKKVYDYEAYYNAMGEDKVNEWCRELILSMVYVKYGQQPTDIIFITGRPEKYREKTVNWMDNWISCSVSRHNLFMRPDYIPCSPCFKSDGTLVNGNIRINEDGSVNRGPDYRPSHEVKREIYEREIRDKYDVLFVLEDDPKCVEMYRSLGLVCLDVGRK
jgi:hypothetical protein